MDLVQATWNRDADAVKQLLAEGADPNPDVDNSLEDPLCLAIRLGEDEILGLLLDAGARVDYDCAHDGLYFERLILYAIHLRRPAAVRMLLERGADPFAEGEHSNLVAYVAVYGQREGISPTGRNDAEGVAGIVLDFIERRHGKQAMLQYAKDALFTVITYDEALVMRQMLARGFDPNERPGDGTAYETWPPLYYAVSQGSKRVVDELMRGGASLEVRSSRGRSIAEVGGAEYAKKRAEELAQEREWQEMQREQAREDREEEAAASPNPFFAAFTSTMAGGASTGGASSNPVDDDTFQQQMAQVGARARERAEVPVAGGSIVVNGTPPPTAAPATETETETETEQATTGGPPAPGPATYRPPERPSSCRDVQVDEKIHGSGPTLDGAESALRSMSLQKCGGRGTGPSVTDKSCPETRQTRQVPRNLPDGTILLEPVEDVSYACTARVSCTVERCSATGAGGGIAQ